MTQPKDDQKAEGEASTSSLPSCAHARAGESDAPTLTDEDLMPAALAAYQVRFIRYDKLVPYARNAQVHDEAQLDAIEASIDKVGFVGAIAADADGILAGHGRTLTAERIYKKGKRIKAPNGVLIPDQCVPWIDATGMSPAARKAYIIADNQLTRRAGQNFDLLRLDLVELKEMDFSLDMLGFTPGALDTILNGVDAAEEGAGDDEPALDEPEAPTVIQCPSCQHQFSVLKEVDAKAKKPKRKKAA